VCRTRVSIVVSGACDASTAGSCKGPPPDCRQIVIRLRYGIKARSDRRATSTGRRRLVNVHANRPLTPSLRRIDRQQSVRWGGGATRKDQASRSGRPVVTESARPTARRNRCRAWRQRTEQQTASRRALAGMGFWHHAHGLVTPGHRRSSSSLTATMTATPATNGRQQQPTTAHNARKSHANLGYVPPEKRTVVRRRRPTDNLAYAHGRVSPRCPRTVINSQQPPPAASCEPEASGL
jgi:hypothetical protein